MSSPKTLEQKRDGLLKNIKISEKDAEKRSGYVDGVLDMYLEAKKDEKEAASCGY